VWLVEMVSPKARRLAAASLLQALHVVLTSALVDSDKATRSLLPDLPDAGFWDNLSTEVPANAVALHMPHYMPEQSLRSEQLWNKFPQWLNNRRLVAKYERVYHGVHLFTVGVYVDKRCDVWSQNWQDRDVQELLERAVGNTTLRYEIVSKYLTRKMWAQDLIGKEIFEHFHGSRPEKASMAKAHERLTYKGPIFHTGALLDFALEQNEVWYMFNGQYIGRAGNHESSKAMLGAWLDRRSSEVFRLPLLNSLARGVEGRSLEVYGGVGEEKMPSWFLILVVLVSATVAFALAACCVCCYWQLKKTAEENSFDEDYFESAA